ncbi:hypothetical protein [Lysinibacillus halotolerans]|uniref:Uncharacterized protein n=1 Tax=Lysinibacillus halotolerans TaxID=1368476 RepID=A0A3M8HD70_9BACI|nr:hypothetical protein [Lysinibacillus halotolerans]RND00260.1 hypothetical protein EC501_05660 [Lysinibacillus halotolerans]
MDWSLSLLNTPPKVLTDSLGDLINAIGISNINDRHVKTVITTIISSLTIIISLLSAIYVFTSREQKSVSPSASTNNRKNELLIFVVCLMLFNIFFGFLIISTYTGQLNNQNYRDSLQITKEVFWNVIILCIGLVLLLHYIIKFIRYLFRTMSLDNMLVDSINHASKLFDTILSMDRDIKFEDYLDKLYRKFHFSLESVYQNLKFVADNDMNKEFEENIEKFKKMFNKLKVMDRKGFQASTRLLKEEPEKIIPLYHSAIRSNLSLIGNLLKNKQYNKAKMAISLYFNLYIDNDHLLVKIFKISLHDLVDVIDLEDEKQLLIFLEGLSRLPEEQTLITYKYLLMKLITNDQIKSITNIVYDYDVKDNRNKTSLLVILLQGLVKSIEISNYEITGFLVKYLVTNYSGRDLNRGLLILKNNKTAFTKVLEYERNIEGISENDVFTMKINEETFEYCFKKATILLFGQHLFSVKSNLWFVNKWDSQGNEIKLKSEFNNCTYSEYIINKIIKASNKYGLLFFDDILVMKKIYQEIGVPYPKVENNKNATNLFRFRIKKPQKS